MSDKGAVTLSMDGAVAHVTFDRPQARNAMTWDMYADLARICDQLAADPSVRCTVFRGAGGEAFVAGTDIEQFLAFQGGDDGVAYEKNIESGIAKMEALPMPTLAVIDGWCVGGGLALATACDIRIATPTAKFGVPIARTLGNCLSIANIARLIAAFGRPRVQRMLLSAELIEAHEARGCGYLAQVVDAQHIDEDLAKRAQQLASLAPVTQAVSKEALRRLLVQGLPEADDLIRRAYGSEDFREGVAAFTQKRQPGWRGR
ncbi:enoyl-CoA hydratase/isomerase family protein [Ramlibacter sp. PS4R-6]|uniref:enoyl-CoA hydratase/isomerase family protein n=1 Tax=Ramlibacter sp. PS4R-6 TaxID=3133438 RepID=UPI0030AAB82C